MTQPAIASIGAYAPVYYISSETFEAAWDRHEAAGIERCAVPDADEDIITMAWEAATRALSAAEQTGEDVAYLALVTTTPPIEEEDLTARLGSLLGVPETARRSSVAGSARAGTQAIRTALDAGPWPTGIGLVVAADVPRGEPDEAIGQAAGAGAAAFVLDERGPAAVLETGQYTRAAPGDRFRQPDSSNSEGLGITAYERRAFREAVVGAVDALDADVSGVDAAAIHASDGREPYRLADALEIDTETIYHGTTVHDLGATEAAGVPLGIARAVDGGAKRILAVGYGAGGGAEALFMEAQSVPTSTALDPEIELEYAEYLRRRGDLAGGEPAGGGAHVSVPSWIRSLPHRHRLEAGRCVACGALSFPAEGRCPQCRDGDRYETVTLPGTGTIEAMTTISSGGAPPEFDRYQSQVGSYQTAIVALDGPTDDTVSVPAMVASSDAVSVGDRVKAIIRRIYTQEGLPRYGFKVTVT